ncbi:hypothetical protein VaNZ11_003843, partial [Volvox africanus]
MVSAGTGEDIALYALSPTMLERPRAMSRLRLPLGMSDSILPRASGNAAKMPTERHRNTSQARIGPGGGDAANGLPHPGLRSPKQFPGAIPGHAPTTWRKPAGSCFPGHSIEDPADAHLPKHQPTIAQQQPHQAIPPQQMQLHQHQVQQVAAGSSPGEGARPKSSGLGFVGTAVNGAGGSGNSIGSVSPPGTLSIITHVLEAQVQPWQTGWSPPAKNQPPRAAFRNARQQQQPPQLPRASTPAVLQYISAASPGGPIPPHLQLGNYRQGPKSASIVSGVTANSGGGGGGSAPLMLSLSQTGPIQGGVQGGGTRRQSLLQRQHSHQQQQPQQQRGESLEAWPSIHSEPSGRGQDGDEGMKSFSAAEATTSSNPSSSESGGMPLPPLSLSGGGSSIASSTPRRRSSSTAAGAGDAAIATPTTAAATALNTANAVVVVGPSTPLHVAKLQNSAWATDPTAIITPATAAAAAAAAVGGVAGSAGAAGLYVFRNAGRSALLAAAESGLIGVSSLPLVTQSAEQFAPPYRHGNGAGMGSSHRPHGMETLVEGDMGSLAWRIIVRYCRRRRLSRAFHKWRGLIHSLRDARQAAEVMRCKRGLSLMMTAFSGWLQRVWRRQQHRRNLARAVRRRLRVYLAAWREQSIAQADAYRLWLLEQVAVACPQALGEEGRNLMGVLHQRQEDYNAVLEARQQG